MQLKLKMVFHKMGSVSQMWDGPHSVFGQGHSTSVVGSCSDHGICSLSAHDFNWPQVRHSRDDLGWTILLARRAIDHETVDVFMSLALQEPSGGKDGLVTGFIRLDSMRVFAHSARPTHHSNKMYNACYEHVDYVLPL